MIKKILLLLSIIFLFNAAFATTYYLQIINPNDYDLTSFQIKVNLTQYGISYPVAQITTLNGTNVPFCYEQPNGECNQTESEVIWLKVPYIPAKDYAVVKIIVNGTNGAVHGDYVFDFYDDFNDGNISSVWTVQTATGCYVKEENGYVEFYAVDPDNTAFSNVGGVAMIYALDIIKTDKFVVEARAMSLTSSDHTFHLEILDYVPATKFFWIGHWGLNNVFAYSYKDDSGNAKSSTSTGIPEILNQWYILKIIKNGPNLIEAYVNNGLAATVTATITGLDTVRIGVSWQNLNEYDLSRTDWIRVRKYADQDPIVLNAYLQSSSSTGTPSQIPTEYNQTYQYVRQVTVLPENSVSISNAQVIIELDTKSLIANGKMQSDCSDIYVTYYDPLYGELPAKFWVDPITCNTNATRIYVKLPTVSINSDWIINIYYGSPGAIPMWDPKNTFAFYVDLTNPSDISQNLIIRTSGTVSLDYTSSGLVISTGSDGKVLIVNK